MFPVDITVFIICTTFGVAVIWSTTAAENCKLFNLSMSYSGRYCPAEGIASMGMLPYQCRYMCLQSPACKAYNYNATEGACTRFTSPCPLAFACTMMEFAVFTEIPTDQCYQWVPMVTNSGNVIDARMISTGDPNRILCRMQKNGDDVVCQYNTKWGKCYANLGDEAFNNILGYDCQRLRIAEGCTALWVPYTPGNPINSRAVIAGHMANGSTVYVTKFDSSPPAKSLAGHYVEGGTHTIGNHAGVSMSSTVMMMLVIL